MKTASRGLIRVISAMLCWMLLPISAFAAGGNPGAEESGIPFSDVASAEDDGLSATSVDAPEIQYEASASASPYPTETPVEENTDPIPATPDPNEEGSFLPAAKTKTQLLIAPMHIRFCFGESLAEAMQRVNGHTFSGLSEACIRAIDGVEGTYRCLNETGTVDLSRPASETKVLLLATDEDALSEEETALIRSMAAYAGSAAAQADEAASALYLTLVESYPTLSRAQMREKAKELQDAIRQESAPVIQAAEPDCKNGFYQITNGGELLWFADLINGERTAPEGLEDVKSAALLCDVSLSGIEWKPIGSRETPFSGEFCGNGHTVSDLSIRAEGDYQALFGYVAASAKLQDLSVFGTVRANGSYVAGIVAYSEASLSGLLNELLGPTDAGNGAHADYGETRERILEFFDETVEYSETAAMRGGNDDFIEEFLTKTKSGCDVHYAAATVMLLRYFGIPARYVEGYLITPEDREMMLPDVPYTLTGYRAHAWAEFYQDGIGFVPLETAPAYLERMEREDIAFRGRAIRKEQTSAAENDPSLEMQEDLYDEGEERTLGERLLPLLGAAAVVLAALLAALGVALLAYVLTRLLERRRSFRLNERDRAAANLYRRMYRLLQLRYPDVAALAPSDYLSAIEASDGAEAAMRFRRAITAAQKTLFGGEPIDEAAYQELYKTVMTEEKALVRCRIFALVGRWKRIWNRKA